MALTKSRLRPDWLTAVWGSLMTQLQGYFSGRNAFAADCGGKGIQIAPPSNQCCSARRLDADQRRNVLVHAESGRLSTLPNNIREKMRAGDQMATIPRIVDAN